MLFSSPIYIFAFLPIVFCGYYFLARKSAGGNSSSHAKIWLVVSSLFFYGYWNPVYLLLIGFSIVLNYYFSQVSLQTADTNKKFRKRILLASIVFNLGLLAYFKYANFFLTNIGDMFGVDMNPLDIALPLAISFFTFQQIAYQVDCYRGLCKETSFLNYVLFVAFFPQLIAGPIVHHKQMMPQFAATENQSLCMRNILTGIVIFGLGLFKKIVIADSFGGWADAGYASVSELTAIDAWGTSLSYTLQLYYDFSGYTDMAIGAALLFNIHLPNNFNSPYKALNIQDFWRRWHITLSTWLKDYVYIPLGGNHGQGFSVARNIMITFILGGLWHGAGWGFVIWGLLHGIALLVFRLWSRLKITLIRPLSWLITFGFVHFSWAFFRAETTEDSTQIILRMFFLNALDDAPFPTRTSSDTSFIQEFFHSINLALATQPALLIGTLVLIATLSLNNSMQIRDRLLNAYISLPRLITYSTAAGLALTLLITSSSQVFLYFNF